MAEICFMSVDEAATSLLLNSKKLESSNGTCGLCLVGWLVVWLVGWLVVWLVGWLVGCCYCCLLFLDSLHWFSKKQEDFTKPVT